MKHKRWKSASPNVRRLFLCADLGVEHDPGDNTAAYLANWLAVMKSDNRAIVQHSFSSSAKEAEVATGVLNSGIRRPNAEAAPPAEWGQSSTDATISTTCPKSCGGLRPQSSGAVAGRQLRHIRRHATGWRFSLIFSLSRLAGVAKAFH
ncbi:zincin-like metallopeptidase domain-containing protein [Allomesorhizobium camelthorni]|uniref:zincin-like metallopeptidase domain-containing protein n=1 Tax=Allomesorhizobium camelthorni TaxID=475069 RepID=UPI003CCCB8BE